MLILLLMGRKCQLLHINIQNQGMLGGNEEEEQKQGELVLTSQERVRIINGLIQELNSRISRNLPLEIGVCFDSLRKEAKPNHMEAQLEYSIPGSRFRHKSKLSNLVGKLEDMEKGVLAQNERDRPKEDARQAEESPESSVEDAETAAKSDDNFRYYKDNILCFRCNKAGHYRAVCPEVNVCLYCFSGSHENQACPQKKVCYRCFGFGHVIANCMSKQSNNRCHLCDKYHEEGCYFLVSKIKDISKKRNFYDEIYRDQAIRCAKCYEFGHIDCPN